MPDALPLPVPGRASIFIAGDARRVFVQHLCDMTMQSLGYEPGYFEASGAKLYWPPKGKLQQARIRVSGDDDLKHGDPFAWAQALVDGALAEVGE